MDTYPSLYSILIWLALSLWFHLFWFRDLHCGYVVICASWLCIPYLVIVPLSLSLSSQQQQQVHSIVLCIFLALNNNNSLSLFFVAQVSVSVREHPISPAQSPFLSAPACCHCTLSDPTPLLPTSSQCQPPVGLHQTLLLSLFMVCLSLLVHSMDTACTIPLVPIVHSLFWTLYI